MGMGHKVVEFTQPDSFSFTKKNKEQAKKIIARYPAGREQSAVMPLLSLAQQQHDGWLPQAAIEYIAAILGMAPIKVKEVASFYTMYNLQPVGKYHIQVCGTTPCMLRGAEAVMTACESRLGIKAGETTPDGRFTLTEVECLGACVNAPMMEVTTPQADGYYEDLTPHLAQCLIDEMMLDELPAFGSQTGRVSSEPETGATTLILKTTPVKKAAAEKKAPAKKAAKTKEAARPKDTASTPKSKTAAKKAAPKKKSTTVKKKGK